MTTAFAEPRFEAIVREVRSRRRTVLVPDDPGFIFPPKDPEEGPPGLDPYQHEGVTCMMLTLRMLLADSTGLGKTVQTLRYLRMLKTRGIVTPSKPALVVVPPNTVDLTWIKDGFNVFTPSPSLKVMRATGDTAPRYRRAGYAGRWADVILANYPIMIRDRAELERAYPEGFGTVVFDEGSMLRKHGAQTSIVAKGLAARSERTIVLTATPIQTDLEDIHSILEVLQLNGVFGTDEAFARRYMNTHVVARHIRGRLIRSRERDKEQPYKNIPELREKLWPYYLRRTYKDLPAGTMPTLHSRTEWLEMDERQARVYEALRKKEIPEGDVAGRRFRLAARALYLRQCATSLQTFLPEAPDHSSKLDWFFQRLGSDWDQQGYDGAPMKIVVYSTWKPTIMTFKRRLEAAGVGSIVLAGQGDLPNGDPFPYGTRPADRGPLRDQFFRDPECRICIGTTAIEMGLNLPVAPVMVNLDIMTNPARMTQLAGRIWRKNSPYRVMVVISLLTLGTVEQGLLRMLEERQDLIDTVNGDDPAQMFRTLSNAELEELVSRDWSAS